VTRVESPDAVLLARARAGDDGAFAALVSRHARAAFLIARAVVGDADLAEDVCQDALFRVWLRLDRCREPERFAAWLARAVRRHALNALRGRRRSEALDARDLPAGGRSPHGAAELADLRTRLDRALLQLSLEQRQAVLLYDLEGWSHVEIAASLGTTEAMSRQHLMLGRRRLRRLLAPEESRP
jgi:RNA polymerase sigma-70 factor (ECF subfamily)